MPSHWNLARTATLLLAFALLAGCSQESDPASPAASTEPVDPATVNTFVDDLPDWQVPSDQPDPPAPQDDEEVLEDLQYYVCEVVEHDLRQNFESIVAVGANATALKPGMLVQGAGVRDGSLSTIGLRRSPLSLSVNLALENPSRTVDEPNSATLQEAIASLQREADTRLGSLPVVPASINFQAQSAYSYEQAMLAAGISLSYDAVFASGSVSAAFSEESSLSQTTVIVKLMQPMYTISFADDALAEPASFFHPDITQGDFDRQVQLGTMGAGNQPCYVQSVTYGRMLVYTMTSTEAESAQELRAAAQASYGAWEGSGSYNERQRQLVSNSSLEVQVFGGTQEDALDGIRAALRDGDFSEFLRPVPATTAVPLSYRINDLKNRQPAVIGDATRFSIRQCEPASLFRFTVSLDSVSVVDGCTEQELFDIESYVWSPGSGGGSWWLLHNDGEYFPRETLADLNNQTIFTLEATQDTELEIYTGVYGGADGGYDGWSRETTLAFPFDFETNPYRFSHINTTSNDGFDNCTLEVHYTIHRALEP